MFTQLINMVRVGLTPFAAAIPMGIKALKYFVDSTVREKVTPIAGSVVYADLWVAVEHSGIYVANGKISNIVVDGIAESKAALCGPQSFTSKSVLGRGIYVSCDQHGAVGHPLVATGANAHVGERAIYGLVIKNCHQFATKCVGYSDAIDDEPIWRNLFSVMPSETWEPTLGVLKNTARKKLGATKWRLWDWDQDAEYDQVPEPDWQANIEFFRNQTLDAENIERIHSELSAAQDYEAEIADENIPKTILQHFKVFREGLTDIVRKYEQVKDFIAMFPDARFTYSDLITCNDDFIGLAKVLQDNKNIKNIVQKMGRNYISEEKKKQAKVPQASKTEVYGTHHSDDVMRMLPSEMLNLEDETLELLFYARLLEKNLVTYELKGSNFNIGEVHESISKRTGPVIACLDTSGSMQGEPLLKAKALLLAIANILKQEDRSLHVILFGSAEEIREFSMDTRNDSAGLLKFLQQGFGGGTNFETPLNRAFEIIEVKKQYKKADILMISDGDCHLSAESQRHAETKKALLNCMIYSVLCAGSRVEDSFSNEIVVL